MNLNGRTISSVIEREGEALLSFTDGTGLLAYQAGNEVDYEVGLSRLGVREVLRYKAKAAGEREMERVRKLSRAGWLALTCEERAAKRKPPESPFVQAFYLEDAFMEALLDPGSTYRRRCERCGDRECPNAQVVTVPGPSGIRTVSGYVTVSQQLLGDL